MYMHIKLYYILVHELTSIIIGAADRGFWHDGAKKISPIRHKTFLPSQEICELAPLGSV